MISCDDLWVSCLLKKQRKAYKKEKKKKVICATLVRWWYKGRLVKKNLVTLFKFCKNTCG